MRRYFSSIAPPPPIRTVTAACSPLSANSALSTAFEATLDRAVRALINGGGQQNDHSIQVHAVQVLMTPHFERLETEYFPATARAAVEERIDRAEAETAGRLLRASGDPDVPASDGLGAGGGASGVPVFGAVVDQLLSRTMDAKLRSHYGVQTSIYYSVSPWNTAARHAFCTPFHIPSKAVTERRSKRVGRWPDMRQDAAQTSDEAVRRNMEKWFSGKPGGQQPAWFGDDQQQPRTADKSSLLLPEELLFWESENWNPLKL